MSYHSDTLAFKKSEILGVIQSICPNFHIDCEVSEDKNSNIEKDSASSYTPSIYSDYKKLFYKQDVFNGFEVACLISGYNPNTLTIFKIRKCKWQEENPKFVHALDFVISASKTGVIFYHDNSEPNHEYSFLISNTDLKAYLKAKDIIIDGFNDDIEIDNANTPKNTDIESQTKIDTLQAELAQAQERIKQLEEMQYSVNENATLEEEISLQDSDLLFISVLLKMLQSEIKVKSQQSQSKILQKIENSYGYMGGLSKSRTEKLMKEANGVYKRLNNKEMK